MPPMPTRWWFRPVSIAARVGEQTAVTWNALYVNPISWTRVRVGVRISPPNVSGPPNPASSMRTMRTFGATFGRLRAGDEAPVRDRLVHGAPDRPTEFAVGNRQHGAIGIELARGFGQGILETFIVTVATDLAGESAMACSAARRSSLADDGEDGRHARLELLAEATLDAALQLVLGELADQRAGRSAHDHRGQHRRGDQTDEETDAAAPAHALAAQVVAGLVDDDLALLVFLDQDHAVGLDLLALDELHQRVEVLLRRLDSL